MDGPCIAERTEAERASPAAPRPAGPAPRNTARPLHLAHRPRLPGATAPGPRHEITLAPEMAPAPGGLPSGGAAPGQLAGTMRFLLDAAGPWLVPADLARLLGAAFFHFAGEGVSGLAVSLRLGDGGQAHAWLAPPVFGREENGFGGVDILFENEVLGLYVLGIAPGRAIPAHCHRVMAESELVLDGGLLQQGRPVAPGAAFHWPKHFVHEYRNPTATVGRILCLDRPRFIPEDEVEVHEPAELLPLAPAGNYFA